MRDEIRITAPAARNQVSGSEYVKTRSLVLPTVELTTLSIPADVSVAPAGSALLLAASPKVPPRRTPAGSVIDMSIVTVAALTVNRSHGDGSHTSAAGGVLGAGAVLARAEASTFEDRRPAFRCCRYGRTTSRHKQKRRT